MDDKTWPIAVLKWLWLLLLFYSIGRFWRVLRLQLVLNLDGVVFQFGEREIYCP